MYIVDASKKTEGLKKVYVVNADQKTEGLKKCYVVNADRKLEKLWESFTKRFIHRYRPQSQAVYARSSEDFVNWTDAVKIGSTFYGGNRGTFVNFGSGHFNYSLFLNGRYYFASTIGGFQYTDDGVDFTTYAENFNPITNTKGSCLTVIDGKFYAVYKSNDSLASISIYTSTDLINWTLVTSFNKINGGANYVDAFNANWYIQLFKGVFHGKERFVIFYRDVSTSETNVMVSDDCIAWEQLKNEYGNRLSISWSNVCIAEDGIYYTTKYVNSDTKWSMKKPDGTTLEISGLDYSGTSQYWQPYFIESVSDKDYLILGTSYTSVKNLFKIPKTGGTAVKVSEDLTGMHDGSWNTHRLLGTCTKLTTTKAESSYAKAGYCSEEGVWTWVNVSTGVSASSDHDLIYD